MASVFAELESQLDTCLKTGNAELLVRTCEELELKVCELDAVPPTMARNYSFQLMAYLIINDLDNAKYLWKRLGEVKHVTPEHVNIWEVGKKLWLRDFAAAGQLLRSTNWSDDVSVLVVMLLDRIQQRMLALISKAYSAVTIDRVASLLGMQESEALKLCLEKGWKQDGTTLIPVPMTPDGEGKCRVQGLGELDRIAEYITSMEKKVVVP